MLLMPEGVLVRDNTSALESLLLPSSNNVAAGMDVDCGATEEDEADTEEVEAEEAVLLVPPDTAEGVAIAAAGGGAADLLFALDAPAPALADAVEVLLLPLGTDEAFVVAEAPALGLAAVTQADVDPAHGEESVTKNKNKHVTVDKHKNTFIRRCGCRSRGNRSRRRSCR
jgi:hypothetical protein